MKKTLITIALSSLLIGCGGAYHKEYNVTKDFKIIVENPSAITERWENETGKHNYNVLGFWQIKDIRQGNQKD